MNKLKQYELACGKIQEVKKYFSKIELYLEHNTYHVRRFSDVLGGKKVNDAWLCLDNYNDAQKAFKRQCEIVGIK